MKHMILLLLMLIPLAGMAQENVTTQDTTLYVKGRKIVIREGDGKIKVKLYEQTVTDGMIENDQIFEGVYIDGQSMERRSSFGVPFMKKYTKSHKQRQQYFEGHTQGIYMGFNRMGDELTPNLSDDIDLNLTKSWNFGFNLLGGSVPISYNHCWGLTAALGWGYTSYRLEGNYAFTKEGNVTMLRPGGGVDETPVYSKSRLRYFHFRIPIALEWQKKVSFHGPVFLAFGPELEVRHGMQSRVKIDGHRKIFKGLNTRPVGINLLLQGGFGNLGAFLRCSTSSIFEKNKGPQFYPWSFGLQWYW